MMNKKGVELTLETVLGLVLGALIVLGLFVGTSKIINTFVPQKQDIDDFNKFKTEIDNLFLTNVKAIEGFNLNFKNNEIIFGLTKSKNINFETISYKSPVTDKENKINSVQAPQKCKDKSCICKCTLSEEIQNSELKCIPESLDCLLIEKVDEIRGDFIIIDENNKILRYFANDYFLVLYSYKTKIKDSFTIPLVVQLIGDKLDVSYPS